MKKLEYKLLPCVFCTIGLNCYVVGHNLVHASVQKLMSHKDKNVVNNPETYTVSKNDGGETYPIESKLDATDHYPLNN